MNPINFTPMPAIAGGLLIAAAAILLMATTGRIAGISGYVSRLLPPYGDSLLYSRIAFVAGIAASPLLYSATTGTNLSHQLTATTPALVAGGLLVGAGTVIGSGCTSGHGVCGMARLSRRSMIATFTFMTCAIATVFAVRHGVGV